MCNMLHLDPELHTLYRPLGLNGLVKPTPVSKKVRYKSYISAAYPTDRLAKMPHTEQFYIVT